MAFNLQRDGPGNDAVSVTIDDRRETLEVAVRWLDAGRTGVKIIGDGRVYTPEEFALTIEEKNPA
jgi:hypothetical protein